MSMTATELFEVVKDVPREAWPSMVVFVANMWAFETKAYPTGTKSYFMPTEVAEHAFIGSMTASLPLGWVAGKCEGHSCKNGNDATHMVYNVTEEGEYVGDSLVAALAAACKEAA